MAKEKTDKYAYPSRFGSHKSMVIKDNEDGTVICKDENGEYMTSVSRLDDNTADPKRWDLVHRKVTIKNVGSRS